MIVVVLEKPFTVPLDWIPYSPFVYRSKTSFVGYVQPTRYDSSYDMTIPTLNTTPINLTTVYIDNIRQETVSSIAEVQATQESMYMDVLNQYVYIHFNHSKRPNSSVFNSQQSIGYCSDRVFYDNNDFCYEPFVKSATSVTVIGDTEKINFPKQNIKLKNLNADFDQFYDEAIPGADVKIQYISSEDLENGKKGLSSIYAGFSTGDTLTTKEYSITSEDKRKQLNIEIPNTYFETIDGLRGNDVLIPIGYGFTRRIAAYPQDTTTTPIYKVASSYYDIGTAVLPSGFTGERSVDKSNWETINITNKDAANGTFQLLSPVTAGEPPEIRIDGRLKNITNPADIIVDLFETYLEIPFTDQYYNTSQWNSEKTKLGAIGIYINERKPLFDWIQTLQTSSTYDFQLITDPDGRWSLKLRDIERATSKYIDSICNVNMIRPVKRSFDNYASSVSVGWFYDNNENTYSKAINNDYEAMVLEKYRLKKNIEVDTLLFNSSNAEQKAERLALEYSEARATHSIDLDELSYIEIFDIIEIDSSFYEGRDIIREYTGNIKIMVTKITYDFSGEQTKLEGLDITGV